MGAGKKLGAGWDKAMGNIKETVGDVTDNEKLEAEGKEDQEKAKYKEVKEDMRNAGERMFDE